MRRAAIVLISLALWFAPQLAGAQNGALVVEDELGRRGTRAVPGRQSVGAAGPEARLSRRPRPARATSRSA